MQKEDFDKILESTKRYKIYFKGAKNFDDVKVIDKQNPSRVVPEKEARDAKFCDMMYKACRIKLFTDEKATEEYARTMFEQTVPFFDELEKQIKTSGGKVSSTTLVGLLEKHDGVYKHFYDVVGGVGYAGNGVLGSSYNRRVFVEHALDRSVNLNTDKNFVCDKDEEIKVI